MTLTDHFLAQLEAEAPKTRRALQNAPAGKDDWKPHDKSMPFGRLAALVARMPSWVTLIVKQEALDLNPPGGSNIPQTPLRTAAELVKAHDEAVADAIATLKVDVRRSLDETLEASRCRQHRQRSAAASRAARHVYALVASSGTIHGVSADEWRGRSGDLRTVGGRSAFRVIAPVKFSRTAAMDHRRAA
jgi:hypothetical protein